ADLKADQVFGLVAELRLGLDDDLPGAAEEIEVVDVERALKDLQRVGEILEADALGHALARLGLDVQLADVGAENGEEAGDARLAHALADHFLGLLLQLLRADLAAVLDHQRETTGPAHAAHRRRP